MLDTFAHTVLESQCQIAAGGTGTLPVTTLAVPQLQTIETLMVTTHARTRMILWCALK